MRDTTRPVRFNGRHYHGPTDTLDTRRPAGFWHAGQVREFTPRLCNEYGRQCHQLNEGVPCKDGDDCTCWAQLFVADWNSHDSQNPWFSLVEPEAPTAPNPPKKAADNAVKENPE